MVLTDFAAVKFVYGSFPKALIPFPDSLGLGIKVVCMYKCS